MKQTTIGFIINSFDGFYFGQLLQAAYDTCRELGYRLIIVHNNWNDPFQIPLAADRIDGWITVHDSVCKEYIEKLLRYKKPIVTISETFDGCHSVMADNRSGMFEAVEHLIQHGHKSIAFIKFGNNYESEERFSGYKDALDKYQIHYNPDLVVSINNLPPSGGRDACEILLSRNVPFTAVALWADYLASCFYDRLKEAGYRLPEDVAIVGFDNAMSSELFNPPLTTIEQPIGQLSVQALKLLKRHMGNPGQPLENFRVKTTFIQRSSCGCRVSNKKNVIKANHVVRSERDFLQDINTISKSLCLNLSRRNTTHDLSWLEPTPIKQACLALYTQDHPRLLKVKYLYPACDKERFDKEMVTTLDQFPHGDILSDYMQKTDVLMVCHLQTEFSQVGAICCTGSLSDIALSDRAIPFLQWVASSFEKEKLAGQLDMLAHYDSLCGLPNRKLLYEILSKSIDAAKAQNHKLAVFLMDLDNFKKVNDIFGHDTGDKLLIDVSRILEKISKDIGLAARLGGDEFVLLLPRVESMDEILHVAKQLTSAINIPFSSHNTTFHVTVSVGISIFPEHGDSPAALLKNSDVAMYDVKERGKGNFCCYK